MKSYDNRSCLVPSKSYAFELEFLGKRISYTYIRKNACSAFKRLFAGETHHDFSSYSTALKAMINLHLENDIRRIESSDFRVFVYRDPVERVLSVYKNKFIQRSGFRDIFDNFRMLTKKDPELTNFRNFVFDYVSRVSVNPELIDPHLVPQVDHLFPIQYNAVIEMSNLKVDMAEILGLDLADRYFGSPVNSSNGKIGQAPVEGPFGGCSSTDLHDYYVKFGFMPTKNEFLDSETISCIKEIYENDCQMIGRLK